jgi:beta-glucanase (GH16 family)
VVAAAGLVTAIWLPARSDSADASERRPGGSYDGWWNQLRPVPTFADGFGGGRGNTVDPAKWMVLADGQFSMGSRNAQLDGDGNLVITAGERSAGGVTSVRLLTRNLLRAPSGHVEARIKTPDGEGLEPAFQLIGAGRPTDSTDRPSFGTVNVLAEPLSDDFHTYALDWTPDEVVFSVDGRELERDATQTLDTDQPFRLSLSLAAGGNSFTPARLLVDSVSFAADEASAAPTTAPTAPPSSEPTTPPSSEPTTAPTTATPTAPTTPPTTPPTSAPVAAKWAPFTDYVAGQIVTYKGVEYQVQETHTSLPGWEPTALPSLFKKL